MFFIKYWNFMFFKQNTRLSKVINNFYLISQNTNLSLSFNVNSIVREIKKNFWKSSLSRLIIFWRKNIEVGNIRLSSTKKSQLLVIPITWRNSIKNLKSHSKPLLLILQFACQRGINKTNHCSRLKTLFGLPPG